MTDTLITDSTRKSYDYGWAKFTDWCAEADRDPLDGDGETVAAWLYDETRRGLKPATLNLWTAGVSHRYDTDPALLGIGDPTKTDKARKARREIARRAARAGVTPKQATPVTRDLLDRLLQTSSLRRSGESTEAANLRHLEAAAVLSLMYDSLLRADEAVRAEWGDISDANGGGFRTLRIGVSKTDQTGRGRYGCVSPTTWTLLERWRAASPTPNGRIATAPTAKALSARIKRLGDIAGLTVSGHSLRRGAATDLAANGASEMELMQAGGWKSAAIAHRYCEPVNAANGAVAKLLYPDKPDKPERVHVEISEGAWLTLHGLTPAIEALDLAATLARTHPEIASHKAVAAARQRVIDGWPLPDPPLPCQRPACPGLVTVIAHRGAERWCSPRCSSLDHKHRQR